MQGHLSKKSDKNKKWKVMYFVLIVDGTDTHLLFYENPKVCVLSPSFSISRLSAFHSHSLSV